MMNPTASFAQKSKICTLVVVFIGAFSHFILVPFFSHKPNGLRDGPTTATPRAPAAKISRQQTEAMTQPKARSNARPLFHYSLTPTSASLVSTRMLLLIISRPSDHKRRAEIRSTWADSHLLASVNAGRVFVLGMTSARGLRKEVETEHQKFGDILLDDNLVDSNRNLTRKVLSALYWTKSQPWSQLINVAKIDDDSFVQVNKLVRLSGDLWKAKWNKKWITGHNMSGVMPIRDPKHKWFVSKRHFAKTVYPDYVNGPVYVLSFPAVHRLVNLQTLAEIRNGTYVPIENVHVTGIAREREQIALIGNRRDFDDGFLRWRSISQLKTLLRDKVTLHLPQGFTQFKLLQKIAQMN